MGTAPQRKPNPATQEQARSSLELRVLRGLAPSLAAGVGAPSSSQVWPLLCIYLAAFHSSVLLPEFTARNATKG